MKEKTTFEIVTPKNGDEYILRVKEGVNTIFSPRRISLYDALESAANYIKANNISTTTIKII